MMKIVSWQASGGGIVELGCYIMCLDGSILVVGAQIRGGGFE